MNLASETKSELLYQRACKLMPGGVNSPVRAFRGVGGTPIFFDRAWGSKIYDVDGNEYIDYVCSWGAVILGHANEKIVKAVQEAAAKGTSFGAPHPGELALAEEIQERIPSVKGVRLVNSGSEATTAAIRVARAATGRNKIIKFEGNYHGAVDSLLARAGSGVATFGLPDTAGVPAAVAADTLVATYNDADSVRGILEANKDAVAAILVEPVAGNMGCVPPVPGFLESLRALATDQGALLIADEVMTGFRVARGGAWERFALKPDLLCMGKVIGGGLPVGAYGGRKDLMDLVAPVGPVYQAGTLSGNPLATAAGFAALKQLESDVYDSLESAGARLEKGLRQVFTSAGVTAQVQRVASMISVFFTDQKVNNFADANSTDREFFSKLFHALLKQGVYLPPSALEAWFFTAAHSDEDIDRTIEAFSSALTEIC